MPPSSPIPFPCFQPLYIILCIQKSSLIVFFEISAPKMQQQKIFKQAFYVAYIFFDSSHYSVLVKDLLMQLVYEFEFPSIWYYSKDIYSSTSVQSLIYFYHFRPKQGNRK